jgi:hypothetical protein
LEDWCTTEVAAGLGLAMPARNSEALICEHAAWADSFTSVTMPASATHGMVLAAVPPTAAEALASVFASLSAALIEESRRGRTSQEASPTIVVAGPTVRLPSTRKALRLVCESRRLPWQLLSSSRHC